MLVRNHLGYFYDVPDNRLYGPDRVVFDGLGNPVGLPILPLLTSLAPMVGDLVGGLFKGKQGDNAPAAAAPAAAAQPACPQCHVCPICPVCPECGTPVHEEVSVPSGMMPMPAASPPVAMVPGGVRVMRVRRRRRFHAR
jgi:hypothetical protein